MEKDLKNAVQLPAWELGKIEFDDKNERVSLKDYSGETIGELTTTMALYIGLSLKELVKANGSVPIWCFDELGLKPVENEPLKYSKKDTKKAGDYFEKMINETAEMFLNFEKNELGDEIYPDDVRQKKVDEMFDGLKKIFLSLWT